MRAYTWEAQLHELQSTDLVAFRSWLLKECTRDQAKRTLSCFHSMLIEMVTQGVLTTDPAARITIQRSRYKEPVEIPSIAEVQSILAAADRLANHKYKYISQPWQRYRAMIYLASDSGLRPQEGSGANSLAKVKCGLTVRRGRYREDGPTACEAATSRWHQGHQRGDLGAAQHPSERQSRSRPRSPSRTPTPG
jgi:hypothetical protein